MFSYTSHLRTFSVAFSNHLFLHAVISVGLEGGRRSLELWGGRGRNEGIAGTTAAAPTHTAKTFNGLKPTQTRPPHPENPHNTLLLNPA